MSLDSIVDVTITAQTAAPSRVGFGIPLVMAYHTHFVERVRSYTGLAGMIADGFTATEDATRVATALFSQNPKPSKILVGRMGNSEVRILTFTVLVATEGTIYTINVGGSDYSYTAVPGDAVNDIAVALAPIVNAAAGITAAAPGAGVVTVTADLNTDQIAVYAGDKARLSTNDDTADSALPNGIAADIAAVIVENDTWSTCHLAAQSHAVILEAAKYIETLYKLLCVSSPDSDIYGAGAADIASTLQTAGYARTALAYHTKANSQYPCAAWAGRCLPLDPGSITWKFKTVSGVDWESFTSTQQGYITAKDCNNYVQVAGISMFQEGVTPSGEFLDIVRGVDFMRARLQEYVFGALARADKVPFTNAGIGVVEAEVNAVMRLCVNNTILAEDPAPVVTVPLVSAVSTTDKSNRLLPEVTFTGTLAGAIHATEVAGTVSV